MELEVFYFIFKHYFVLFYSILFWSCSCVVESGWGHVHCTKKMQRHDECWSTPGIWCKNLFISVDYYQEVFLNLSSWIKLIWSVFHRERSLLRGVFSCRTPSWWLNQKEACWTGWRREESSSLSRLSSSVNLWIKRGASQCLATCINTASRYRRPHLSVSWYLILSWQICWFK